ncbi:hypothetical protein [Paraburkholderia sp. JPY419]|uniref:hypothetical protein n=1 Tax=Paraburkholderia sp. JPY419 TaxID=667660 RepID=UPI003D1F24E2
MMQKVADTARPTVRNEDLVCEVIRMAEANAITARSANDVPQDLGVRSALAVVPKIDQGVGESLEGVVHVTDAFEAQQQAAELVLPGEHALDGPKAFLEDGLIEMTLAATFLF